MYPCIFASHSFVPRSDTLGSPVALEAPASSAFPSAFCTPRSGLGSRRCISRSSQDRSALFLFPVNEKSLFRFRLCSPVTCVLVAYSGWLGSCSLRSPFSVCVCVHVIEEQTIHDVSFGNHGILLFLPPSGLHFVMPKQTNLLRRGPGLMVLAFCGTLSPGPSLLTLLEYAKTHGQTKRMDSHVLSEHAPDSTSAEAPSRSG